MGLYYLQYNYNIYTITISAFIPHLGTNREENFKNTKNLGGFSYLTLITFIALIMIFIGILMSSLSAVTIIVKAQ